MEIKNKLSDENWFQYQFDQTHWNQNFRLLIYEILINEDLYQGILLQNQADQTLLETENNLNDRKSWLKAH